MVTMRLRVEVAASHEPRKAGRQTNLLTPHPALSPLRGEGESAARFMGQMREILFRGILSPRKSCARIEYTKVASSGVVG